MPDLLEEAYALYDRLLEQWTAPQDAPGYEVYLKRQRLNEVIDRAYARYQRRLDAARTENDRQLMGWHNQE